MLTEGRRSNHQWLIEDSVFGQTGEHLDRVFDALPEAGLCFDVPHAASIDPTLAVAREILDRHGARLRHVHLSSLDADCHHQTLTSEDEKRFAELLDRCRDVPWILEAPPPGR
jgi:sugar phosphate isomerase/epimerase